MTKPYDLDCPVARTLDIVGEKWTLLVLRDLLLKGPQRFHELETSLTGLPPSTLSARLKVLEAAGIVAIRQYDSHPPRFEYVLTQKGKELGPVLQSLREWGNRHTSAGPAP
jgi:DNA-binding HxlR family transcriptional regulator